MSEETQQVEEQPIVDENIEQSMDEPIVEEQERHKKTAKERIDELTWQRRQAERETSYERQKRIELEERVKQLETYAPKNDKSLPNGAPDASKYEAGIYDPAYIEALTDYRVEQKFQDQMRRQLETQSKKFFKDAGIDHPLASVPQFAELIGDTEQPVELAKYLGENPDELDKIQNMTVTQAARYLGRLEAQMTNQSTKATKSVSAAPIPIKPLTGAKTSGNVETDPEKMTMEQYAAYRKRAK